MNHNPWMLLYFISFLLIVAFFVLNMFVGVVVENFHKCRQHQEAEEARRREEKRLRRLERRRRSKAAPKVEGRYLRACCVAPSSGPAAPPAQMALHVATLHGGQVLEEGPTRVSRWGACCDRMQGTPTRAQEKEGTLPSPS